jgi:NAD(P)-dependent dehydrogenase (short-subunit alcohol dehydrogenase family)
VTGELEGKAVLVVGASGGIGYAACELLVERGARVVMTYRKRSEQLEALATRTVDAGGVAVATYFEAGRAADVAGLTQRATDAVGPIDACINTVGYVNTLMPFLEQPPAEDDMFIDIELRLTFELTRNLLPQMIERRTGSIVVVGSDSGKVGMPGEAISSACRAGVIGFTKAIAHEFGKYGVRMNSVCPGPIDTDLWESVKASSPLATRLGTGAERATSLRRMGTAVEAAELAVFLASDRSSYLTGQAVSINGGGVRA